MVVREQQQCLEGQPVGVTSPLSALGMKVQREASFTLVSKPMVGSVHEDGWLQTPRQSSPANRTLSGASWVSGGLFCVGKGRLLLVCPPATESLISRPIEGRPLNT